MSKKLLIPLILLLIIILLLINLGKSGLFYKIKLSEKIVGPFTLVYEEHIGPYNKIGPVIDKIYYSLLEDKVLSSQGFGIYYDDPKKTEEDELRSIGGCLISDSSYLPNDKYKVLELNPAKAIVAEFPYKNKTSLFLGVLKFYPAYTKYIKKNNLEPKEIMEIYDMPNHKIIYIGFLKNSSMDAL